MHRTLASSIVVLALVAGSASARPDLERAGLSAPGNVGQVTFRWLGLPLYRAALFTEEGADFTWQRPMALELAYLRNISRDNLLEATLTELERIEGRKPDLDSLLGKLRGCFRDVRKGDTFVAVARARDVLSFWLNGRKTCELRHTGVRERFLGIWLSDKSRSASLSRQLRGE